MSTTVDQRIVEMQFDNKQFERNVSTTMSTLDKLNKSLDFTGASKGLDNLNDSAKRVDMSGIGNAVQTVQAKFSALEVMAVTALANITNSAIQAGSRIVSSLTIDPIKMGFSEYETQINAIQTILANTSHAGTDLEDVTKALDDLNLYADKTIYNFTEMTRNIGTFTAAGLGLEESTQAIKGIANLAAVSGSTSAQASTAMYQLSQALANGTVTLQDWNSVVNAGMGGKVFQDALVRTAAAMEGVSEETFRANNIFGSFRESISSKDGTAWLTSDILSNTLRQFTGDLSDAELAAMGFTKTQIESIQSMAVTANDAATKVKTVTQLMDTLKESAQSGWTQSWEIIVGDFEEAKELLTQVSDTIGGMIGASADARNQLLSDWKILGGRTALIDAIRNAFNGVLSVIDPVSKAFREIFPPITAEQLYNFTTELRELTEKFKLSDAASENLKNTFKGLFAVVDIVGKAFFAVVDAVGSLLGGVDELGGGLLSVTGTIGKWLTKLNDAVDRTNIFNKVFGGIANIIKTVANAFRDFVVAIAEKIKAPGLELLHSILERVQARMSDVGDAASDMKSGVVTAFEVMGNAVASCQLVQIFQAVWNAVKTITSGIVDILGKLASSLASTIGDINFSGLMDLFNSISLGTIAVGLMKLVKGFGDAIEELGDIKESFVGILDSVRGCFEAYQKQLQAGTLVKIATAIGILAASILVLSLIDSDKLSASLGALTVVFADLMVAMAVFNKISGQATGVLKTCTAMIAMSASVLILASALKKIGDLNFGQMMTGLVGIAGLTAVVVAAAKVMGSGGQTITKGATQMVIFAAAVKVLASACEDLSSLNVGELTKGLVGVGILLAEISLFMNNTKFSGKSITTATGIVILAAAIKVLASACEDFGNMKWGEIAKGLTSISVLLAELVVFTKLTGDAKHVISTGVALIAIAAAMKIFASAVEDFAAMSWEEIAKGLVAMAGALTAVTVAVNFMPKNMVGIGTGLVVVSAALLIIAEVLDKLGGMSWEAIAKGLVSLGGAMTILAVGLNAMNGTLAGSAAMLVAAAALLVLTPVLSILGAMSWEAIVKGLVALAGAFTVIGVAGLVLTPLVPTILGLSAALALIGAAVLGIGAGLLLAGTGLSALAVGITALAAAGTAGATAITAAMTVIVMGVASLIPELAAKLGEAVVVFYKVIADNARALGDAVKALVLMIVDVLVECIPAIADGALKLVVGVLEALVAYTPAIVDAIFNFLIGVIDGIARNLPGLIQATVNMFMAYFTGIVDALKGIDTKTLIEGIAGIGLLSAIMIALAAVAVLIPGAMVGVLGMGAVIAELALVLGAIGIWSQLPGLNWLINEGAGLLQNIGTAIGGFVGGIVGGFMSGVSSQFPKIGSDLAAFMENVQPFIDGASAIDSSMLNGVKALGETILLLTAANILDGLTSWLTGGSSLSGFAEELVPFGKAMKQFANEISGIDGAVIANAAIAGKTLAEMAATLPNTGGVVGWFAGENDMGAFGDQLVPFGRAMKNFANEVAGIDANVVAESATAGKALAEMAATLPNTGGVIGWFAGNNDMSVFGEQLVPFGKAMREYGEAVSGLDADVITNSANAALALVELSNNLPNTGGVVSWFTGDNDMAEFGEKLSSFGESLSSYYHSVKGIDTFTLGAVSDEFGKLIEIAKGIREVDTSEMSKFAKNLTKLGESGVEGFIGAFTDATDKVARVASDMVTTFANEVKAKGDILNSAFETVLNSCLASIKKKDASFGSAAQTLVNKFTSGVKTNELLAKTAFVSMVTSCLTAIKSKASEFADAGKTCITKFISSVESKSGSVASSFTSGLSNAVSSIRGYYSSFYNAGGYLVSGFAAGIDANSYKAAAQAAAMAKAAAKAAEEELEINSPSKVGYRIGDFFGLGFINSLADYSDKSYDAGESIASSAKDGLRNAVSRIAELVDEDIDVQPTITPVLDISSVQSGVKKLSALFSRSQAMTIDGEMNHNSSGTIQNGEETPSTGNTYSFTQNNYSPKALSRVEIYRQTKNQFSALERMVNA